MFYVYVLHDKNGNFYTGYSKNLKSRLQEHISGKVFATKSKLPVKLIYYESCLNDYDATKREKYLKSGPGKKFLRYRLKYFLSSLGPVRTLVRDFRPKASKVSQSLGIITDRKPKF